MLQIPIIPPNNPPTTEYLLALKDAIKSDGCSGVPDIYGDCCIIHDLCYRFGIDVYGNKVKKITSDEILRKCMQGKARLGRFSPVSWMYWLGVKWFGWRAYGLDVDDRPGFTTYYWKV